MISIRGCVGACVGNGVSPGGSGASGSPDYRGIEPATAMGLELIVNAPKTNRVLLNNRFC
jgi:hypothetical protein